MTINSVFLSSELDQPLDNKIIFFAVKGLIPESILILGEYLNQKLNVLIEKIMVIVDPSNAEEIVMERLSYLTVDCIENKLAKAISAILKTPYVRTTISNDIMGTEYASMLKNIYVIASRIAHALGYDDNFQSVLMSNAIREMKRFIKDVYKIKRNINNSNYLGDLLVTAYSVFSLNRSFR